MRSFNPFTSVSGRYTLFEIRLDNDFIVFRGNDHEASGQLLKGTVVLCLSTPLRLEDIHLKLTGTAHYAWTDAKVTATGISTTKVDKTLQVFEHRWQPFEGIGAPDPATGGARQQTKGVTLQPGNYEWPFELMLPGDTTESVEGLREASIRYRLKATVARGKLVHDIHAYKQVRVIRTLEPSALEFLHAMSVENIWPNKIDYSIVVPQKAVVFGSTIPVEMRFTPLLKGLELGDISIKLVEIHDIILQSSSTHVVREHKKDRQIDSWTIPVTREEHWHDVIDDTGPDGWEGQEGWVVNTSLNLPKKLSKCLQDVNTRGIKIRHKLKIVVALNNPDGHVSELRATLPVTIFISPNVPLDEEGNLVRQLPAGASREAATIAPPAYEHHRLDQLYDDMEPIGPHSPAGGLSGVNSPFRGHSRAGSTENLPALIQGPAIQPDVLAYRLHSMSLEERHRNESWNSNLSAAGAVPRMGTGSPPHPPDESPLSASASTPLTRQNSGDNGPSGAHTPAEHVDFPEITELSKVPSYHTAVRTPVKPLDSDVLALPDYQTALSAPSSPPGSPHLSAAVPSLADSLDTITTATLENAPSTTVSSPDAVPTLRALVPPPPQQPQPQPQPQQQSSWPAPPHHRRQSSGLSLHGFLHLRGEGDEGRRLHLLQARSG